MAKPIEPASTDFFEEIPAGGAAPQAAADPQVDPNISEDATKGGGTPPDPAANSGEADQTGAIPKDRFDKVYAEAKANERRAQELEAEIAKLKDEPNGAGQIDDRDAEAKRELARLGYISKDELEKEMEAKLEARLQRATAEQQFETDMKSLESQYKDFDRQKVIDHLTQTVGSVKSKDAMEAAYFFLNRDAILENERKRVLAEVGGGKGVAETPGQGGSKAPEPSDPKGKSMKELIREAHQNIKAGQ